MSLQYGKEFIDLNSRDEEGRDYLLRMLREPMLLTSHLSDHHFSRKIRHLVSHGADIGARDKLGISCLHALFSTHSLDLTAEFLMDLLCLLVQLGADIHAVAHSGYSVTEWAHFLRKGRTWEEALGKAGYDVERVYFKDFNRGWSIADDGFAPAGNRPRRRGSFSKEYYNLTWVEVEERRRFAHPGESKDQILSAQLRETIERFKLPGFTNEYKLDESESETVNEEEEDEQDVIEEQELYNNVVLEEHSQGPLHGFVDESPPESDSDEEMGGVPVTN